MGGVSCQETVVGDFKLGWFNNKRFAEHGAAARAHDCLVYREKQQKLLSGDTNINSKTEPELNTRLGVDEPYLEPRPLPHVLKIKMTKETLDKIQKKVQEARGGGDHSLSMQNQNDAGVIPPTPQSHPVTVKSVDDKNDSENKEGSSSSVTFQRTQQQREKVTISSGNSSSKFMRQQQQEEHQDRMFRDRWYRADDPFEDPYHQIQHNPPGYFRANNPQPFSPPQQQPYHQQIPLHHRNDFGYQYHGVPPPPPPPPNQHHQSHSYHRHDGRGYQEGQPRASRWDH